MLDELLLSFGMLMCTCVCVLFNCYLCALQTFRVGIYLENESISVMVKILFRVKFKKVCQVQLFGNCGVS